MLRLGAVSFIADFGWPQLCVRFTRSVDIVNGVNTEPTDAAIILPQANGEA